MKLISKQLTGLFLLVQLAAAANTYGQPLPEVIGKECVYGDCDNGSGRMEFSTPAGKAVYRGIFREGEFHGQGRLEEPLNFNQKAVYIGIWENGKRNGRGTYWDGKKDLYIGQWRNDKRHGHGSYFVNLMEWHENEHTEFWLSQNTENYTGEFVNDLYQGQGVYRWKNGTRYEGGFFANDKHGFGTFYYQTGTIRKQLWDYGDLVR